MKQEEPLKSCHNLDMSKQPKGAPDSSPESDPGKPPKQRKTLIQIGQRRITLSAWTVIGFVLVVILFFVNILLSWAGPDWEKYSAGVHGFLGIAAGWALAPEPVPMNHGQTARAEIESLFEIRDELERSQEWVTSASRQFRENGLFDEADALRKIQDRFLAHMEKLVRSSAAWEQISPGATDEILVQRSLGSSILAKLSKENKDVE